MIYLCTHGVPLDAVVDPADEYVFVHDRQGGWKLLSGDGLHDVEWVCALLHERLAAKIFGTLARYRLALPQISRLCYEGGLNSESSISRVDFERALDESADKETAHRALYLYDCRKLVAGIQECTKEISHLTGEFYRSLNLDEPFISPGPEADGLRYVTSPVATYLTALISIIYMRLYSLLDYSTKLAYEIEHLKSDFAKYPRFASANIQYGDRKKVKINDAKGSLFESCELITEIETVRHLVTHDGLLDDLPKLYKVVAGGSAIEKFVLMPDMAGGRLEKFKNRNLFFSREDKINLRLPKLVMGFRDRQVTSLELMVDMLGSTPASGEAMVGARARNSSAKLSHKGLFL